MAEFYKDIISKENIKTAYLEIVQRFEEEIRTRKYYGTDGKIIRDYDLNSLELVYQIRKELIERKKIDPAIKMMIPKGNKPGFRTIFIHTIKERVKAHAIYRIIQPELDQYFSDFLYSYRASHPHYKAAMSVGKRYRKNFKEDTILIGDISDYCDNMDKEMLKSKIEKVGFGDETNSLINLFIDNEYIDKGEIKKIDLGLVHGQPLISVFYNIYVDHIDKSIGKKVSLYRRVGDDFIMFDKNPNKIIEQRDYLVNELIKIKIPAEKQKIKIQNAAEKFKFLGYDFDNGKISICKSSENKIKARWRRNLKYYPVSKKTKDVWLDEKMNKINPLHHEFMEIIKQYSQVNNQEQIKSLSNYFFRRLTVYYTGNYSNRNQRLVRKITKRMDVPSFRKYAILIKTGKKEKLMYKNN